MLGKKLKEGLKSAKNLNKHARNKVGSVVYDAVNDMNMGSFGYTKAKERNERLQQFAKAKGVKKSNYRLKRDPVRQTVEEATEGATEAFDELAESVADAVESASIPNKTYRGSINHGEMKFEPDLPIKLNPFIHELAQKNRNDIISKAFPYRFNGWVTGTILAGSGVMMTGGTIIDAYAYDHARKIGPISYDMMANHVGITPNTRNPKFIKSIPQNLYQRGSVPAVLGSISTKKDSIIQSYDDGSAGGDLVFAMHNLR